MTSESNEKRNIVSFIGIIGIGLTTVIGSGIWRDPLGWANGSGFLSILALIITWLFFLTAGLSYAECVSMFPKSGGPYSFVGGAINKKWGAFVGILYFIGYLFISALLSFLTASFTLSIFNVSASEALILLTLGYLILFSILAGISSPRLLGYVAFIWVSIKIILLIVVSIIALANAQPQNLDNLTFGGFVGTIEGSIWALLGFEVMLIFAGELNRKDGRLKGDRKLSYGILIALGVIFIIYLLVSIAASSIIGIGDLTGDPFAALAASTGIGASLLFFFAAFSAGGTAYAVLTACIHQLRVMARDESLPQFFNKSRKGIYFNNIIVTMILTLIIGFFMTYYINPTAGAIIGLFAAIGIGLILFSAMIPAGIIALYLRVKMPILERPFKSPIYYIVFPVAIILSFFLFYLNIAAFF